MSELNFSVPPYYSDWNPVSREEATRLAESYLRSLGIRVVSMELAGHALFIAVFRFKGWDEVVDRGVSGWVVGGTIPHLYLSDLEIQTSIEALAIYALYERAWLNAKGLAAEDGSVPVYKVPPSWDPLTFNPGFKASRMGAVTSFIAWHLLPSNREKLVHKDIVEKCRMRGWLGAC